MTIKEITLLSKEEYKKYKPIIPVVDDWWWLRSPGSRQNYAAIVDSIGSSTQNGYFVYNVDGVRPALRLNLAPSDNLFWYKPEKHVGTKIKFGNYWWTILDSELGELYVLCDKFIAKRSFDSKSNDWEKSKLKQWLETEGIALIALEDFI